MSKCLIIVTLFALLAGESHAATVERKRYVYLYESARDTGSDSEYVIRDNTHRSPLLPEPKALPLALRFGESPATVPLPSSSQIVPMPAASTSRYPEYRLEKNIHFGFDSAHVKDKRGLSLLATSLKTDPSVTAIRIKGFTCDLGNKSWNDRLAMRRAVAVGDLLGKTGLRISEVSGEGNCCYVPGSRRLSRRVEILVKRSLAGEKHDEK